MARESEDDQRRLEEASGRGDRKDWFKEEGCPKSSKVNRLGANDNKRSGMNPAISAMGTVPYKTELL